MASILDRYGIKEVADVTFYKIKDDGTQDVPVLYLDTLKVSTIEQTAETTDARGGKGNPKLVIWDYGKDITVTLEDALFSAKSLSIMFGNGTVGAGEKVTRTIMARTKVSGEGDSKTYAIPDYITMDIYDKTLKGAARTKVYTGTAPETDDGKVYLSQLKGVKILYVTDETSTVKTEINGLTLKLGEIKTDKIFITYEVPAVTKEIVISADTFPGTYYVTGDTYARSDVNGEDQFFQFIIQKAKVTSENTITLEAEGDPSVFNMNLTVLRPEDGEMMKLVQYDLTEDMYEETTDEGDEASL